MNGDGGVDLGLAGVIGGPIMLAIGIGMCKNDNFQVGICLIIGGGGFFIFSLLGFVGKFLAIFR